MTNPFSLEGKVIVQCGGTGLLGRELVKAIGQAGATLVVGTRDPSKFGPNLERAREARVEVQVEKLIVSDEDSVNAFRDAVLAKNGRVDGLVYNTVSRPMKGERPHADEWRDSMETNATGLYLTMNAFVEVMEKQPTGGSIVNISSMMGMVGPNMANYEGTDMKPAPDYFFHKSGMINVSRYYASVYGTKGVRCNVVSPGGIFNPEAPQPDAFLEKYNKRTMMGRMANADEMNGAVIFLLSDAAAYVTGINLPVDGGFTGK
ncbi:MAG: alcohol dehydrogenase [Opitutaceae bacterium]|nr:alcohol dehydrogenase [Opitutaceae bacterium]|tara:strand:- start:1679 stop:2461 length:783 start_codon:yes stop_codon:yes gene_type:complete